MNKGIVRWIAILAMGCSTSGIQNNSPGLRGTQTGSSGTSIPNDSLSIGLVAWYPMNGNANDASGNGFDGIVNGATLVADRFGNPNSAYSFNGYSNYINCGDILDSVFCAPVAKFSVSGWANTRSAGSQSAGGGCIVTKSGGGDAGPYQWAITHYVGNVVCGAVFSEPTGTNRYLEKSNGPAPLNQWFHFIYIFDGSLPESDRLKIYINGSRANEQTVLHKGAIGTTTTETGASVCIGSSMNLPAQPGNFYNGTVDDVRIYNRPLSSDEARKLYHERGYTGSSIAQPPANVQAVPAQNPAKIAHDPGTIEIRTGFVSPAGYQVLYPGDKGNLKILVRNIGQNVVKNAKARIAVGPPTKDIEFDRLILIGDIAPGAEVESGCSVIASQNVGTRSLEISVQITADEGIIVHPKFIKISTKAGTTSDKIAPEIRLTKPLGVPVDPARGMKTFSGSGVLRTKAASIEVEGTARDASGIAAVRINGSEIQLKTSGQIAQFNETVSLSPGENHIEIVAVDNFRNESSMRIAVQREGGWAAAQNYALLFAERNYDAWPHLVNPVPDAQAIAEELKKSYGFKTELLQDVTRDGILTALRRYAEMKFNDNDQLFIFYAGHGQFDPVLGDGYLVAKDSKLNDDIKTSYVAHSVLRTIVNNIPCRHILLVVDACFGGTIDPLIAANSRGDDTYGELSKTEFIQRKLQFKTRRFLTSGGKEYVPDGRPGQHSPFVRKFLEALRSYGGSDGVLTINEILQYEERVTPQPRAGEFGANEPGSDFIFLAR